MARAIAVARATLRTALARHARALSLSRGHRWSPTGARRCTFVEWRVRLMAFSGREPRGGRGSGRARRNPLVKSAAAAAAGRSAPKLWGFIVDRPGGAGNFWGHFSKIISAL